MSGSTSSTFTCSKFGDVTFHVERDETGKVLRDPVTNEITCLATASTGLSKDDRRLINGAVLDVEHTLGLVPTTKVNDPEFVLIFEAAVTDDELEAKFRTILERADARYEMISAPDFFDAGRALHSTVGPHYYHD